MLCFEPDPTKAKVLYDAKVRRLCPGPGGPGGPGEDPETRGPGLLLLFFRVPVNVLIVLLLSDRNDVPDAR